MKTVYYIRHAKSSWTNAGVQDIDRPLNDRGLRDAPLMAKQLHKLADNVCGMISSPAQRARDTADFFITEFNISKEHVLFDQQLYHPSPDYLLDCLYQLPDQWNTLFVITHNPAITMFIADHASEYVDNISTCGIAKTVFLVNSWQEVGKVSPHVEFVIKPKMYINE